MTGLLSHSLRVSVSGRERERANRCDNTRPAWPPAVSQQSRARPLLLLMSASDTIAVYALCSALSSSSVNIVMRDRAYTINLSKPQPACLPCTGTNNKITAQNHPACTASVACNNSSSATQTDACKMPIFFHEREREASSGLLRVW